MIKIAKGNVQENITLHKKNDFLALFWLKSQEEMYKKILHNTKKILHNTIKRSFSIILIEMATANVQENITQHKKHVFLVLFWLKGQQENITHHKKSFF